MRRLILSLLLTLAALFATPANAHEVRPAYLQIDEASPGRFAIYWKQPAMGELALRLVPHLSNGWIDGAPASLSTDPGYLAQHWSVIASDKALGGAQVSVDGLADSITDVLVRVSLADGRSWTTILRPSAPSATIGFAHVGGLALPAYFTLGVEHILTGIDHLCFVLGLLLMIGLRWSLLKAITAFTVAHSLTLAASALGYVHVPPAPVEALVALSILFLAVELVRQTRGANGLAQRAPWIVAFAFGLLHGLAFAGALAEIGLPPKAIPQALLLFNLGVEAGQLLFVGAAALVYLLANRLVASAARPLSAVARAVPQYALGSFAAFWLIQRTALIFV
jgi:hydrogenase/urease accessory protein HupE